MIEEHPRPTEPRKILWHRRYTWLVSSALAASKGKAPLSPEEAGHQARKQIRREWSEVFPTEAAPEWLP